ncbi:cyclophilin-like fold protein [Bifidobacterium oedipodis]|uniref:Cyclophilin-like domain-containing protein n=1 Tax=Bifidobacterium oedipodis TaxID=2675322 RepID=A0A7Y0HTA8_9BIFI|nr:cyclophilin-like fold protein [Bifidobacterium sp. DSM 109957]NMM94413.1 hypothetical protein [Bifidobacterium sp. DSM 109957]
MNNTLRMTIAAGCALALSLTLAGCAGGGSSSSNNTAAASGSSSSSADSSRSSSSGEIPSVLEVRFGDDGAPFALNLESNATASAIAGYVAESDWRLPIYHYDDFEDSDVMQYYDIPSRYEIPSNPGAVTEEHAGELYYSHPNRIILFYRDAQVSGEYTKVGEFDPTDDFVNAVINNPVLEGWGNKIVQIGVE